MPIMSIIEDSESTLGNEPVKPQWVDILAQDK